MSELSTNLSLPFIQASQAQKHVTHNEAIELLDVVVQLTLEAIEATTPPANAAEGQAWSIGAGASGAWAGQGGNIAAWRNGGWLFVEPNIGWRAFDKTSQAVQVFSQTGWAVPASGLPDLDNLAGVGVNASADATNRLVVSSPATLLNHEGAGHQLKINKFAPTDTGSLLFQSNWSGRAEMGLAGNDDFSVKVSDDGTTFHEALRVDAATGQVAMPNTGQRHLIQASYRYYLFDDRRWAGHTLLPHNYNASQSLGSGTDPAIAWDSKGPYLPAGTQINSITLFGWPNPSGVNDVDIRFGFQYGPWATGWNSTSTTTYDALIQLDDAAFSDPNANYRVVTPTTYTTPADGYVLGAARHGSTTVLTATSYFNAGIVLDVILPPLT